MLVLNASGDTTRPIHLPPPTMKDRTTQSDPWGHGIDVKRLADRLDELADYVTQGADCVRRNFVMRVPAEPYHDADLVISTAARLLRDGLVTPPSSAKPAANPVNLAELHDPGFSDGLTASQHLDVLRGGPDPRADQAEEPSLDDVAELCEEFGFVPGNNGALLAADVFRAPPLSPLQMLRDMITAAITRWRAPVAQPAAQPVNVANLMRLTEGVDPYAPGDPDVDHIQRLAEIIRKVDGGGRLSNWDLAEAILAHPGLSGCHDGPVASPAQGEPSKSEEPIEWVVNSMGELGVCSNGRYYFLYKGRSIEYDGNCEDADVIMVRPVGKREFGEVCKPIGCLKVENGILYDRTPYPYLEELLYTPGLSDPGDYSWRPLPSRPPAKGKAGKGAAAQEVLADRYEFSVLDSDDCEQAGGSAPTLDDAIREGRNYLAQYKQDGPHKLQLRRVLELDCSEPTNA
jgi:hypothetical protein